jgi:hypothetical protein
MSKIIILEELNYQNLIQLDATISLLTVNAGVHNMLPQPNQMFKVA